MSLISEIGSAAELQEQLDRLQSADGNLSPKGAIAECKRLGGVDKEADRVIAEIESGSADGKQLTTAFARVTMMVKSFARTSILKPKKMSVYLGDATEALSRMQVSRASLMLAVVRKLVATDKGLWGEMDSPTSHQAKIKKVKDELEMAYKRIEAAITLGDLTVHETIPAHLRAEGLSRVTFRITGDLVTLGDGRDVPERLVGWWLQNDGRKRRAA